MLDDIFKQQLKVSITSSDGLDQAILLIKQFRDRGGKKEVAADALSALLEAGLDVATDDQVRDCLDYVTGWCHSRHNIWPDQA